MMAGHLGGSLTHGATYLTVPFTGTAEVKPALPPIPQVQEADVYNDLVGPLLQKRCVHCHSPQKPRVTCNCTCPKLLTKEAKAVWLCWQANPAAAC